MRPEPGVTYWTLDKNKKRGKIQIGEKLGEGGEGIVFNIYGYEKYCAKIYTKEITVELKNKIELMCQNPPSDPMEKKGGRSIAWPVVPLYEDRDLKNFVGFIMPKIDFNKYKKMALVIDPFERKRNFFSFTWSELYQVALNLCSAIAAIHKKGYIIGDLNESNILVSKDGLVCIIDCDSFQVVDKKTNKVYRCPVGKGSYTAPEFQDKSFKDTDRTIESDNFALGVLLFQILMEGFHPYQARGPLVEDAPSIESKIKKGYFPYCSNSKNIEPPPDAPPFGILFPEIQELFKKCFAEGHKNPEKRPSAEEWYAVFLKNKDKFKTCNNNHFHSYADHLKKCPWCEIKQKKSEDPFPPPLIGKQTPISRPGIEISPEAKERTFREYVIGPALADGVISSEEREFIKQKGKELGFKEKEVERIIKEEEKKVRKPPVAQPKSVTKPSFVLSEEEEEGVYFVIGGIIGLFMNILFPFLFSTYKLILFWLFLIGLTLWSTISHKESFGLAVFWFFILWLLQKFLYSIYIILISAFFTYFYYQLSKKFFQFFPFLLWRKKGAFKFAGCLLLWGLFVGKYIKDTNNLGIFDRKKETKFYIEIKDLINVRVGPDIKFYEITRLPIGRVVDVIEEKGNWYKIRFNKNKTIGWVYKEFTEPVELKEQFLIKINANNVNIRSKPSLDGEIITRFPENYEVKVMAEKNNWYKIIFYLSDELFTGWIYKPLTKIIK
ncbi:MAG: SH3 domain-containing protein [candidate division WOR-3 bacterium]